MIQTKPLLTMQLYDETPLQNLGLTPLGDRRIAQVTGGNFNGPKLNGIVLPGGGDWLLLRNDGVLMLDVRLTLRTHDDSLIYVTYRGLRHGPDDIMLRLNNGESVDPSQYYFRISPVFETSSKQYSWLNKLLAVGTGNRLSEGPFYTIYEIL